MSNPLVLLALACGCASVLAAGPHPMTPQAPTPALAQQQRQFEQRYGGSVLWSAQARLPARISRLQAKLAGTLSEANADAAFRQFLKANQALLGVEPSALKLASVMARRGRVMAKYQQYHGGVKVEAAEVGFVASADGVLTQYSSSYAPGISIPVQAKVAEAKAEALARQALGDDGPGAKLLEIEKVIARAPSPASAPFRLVYRLAFDTQRTDRNPSQTVEVDADTGEVLRRGDRDPSAPGHEPGHGAAP